MLNLRSVFVGLTVLAVSAGAAQGQRFGAQVSWADDTDLGIGARLEYDIGASLAEEGTLSRTYLIGSFDYFPDCGQECSYFEFNGNLAVPVSSATLNPYVGTGLNMGRISVGDASDTQFGLNLLGGLKFAISRLASFAEARLELKDESQLVLTFGVMLGSNR
jgi:hypothetical protein